MTPSFFNLYIYIYIIIYIEYNIYIYIYIYIFGELIGYLCCGENGSEAKRSVKENML